MAVDLAYANSRRRGTRGKPKGVGKGNALKTVQLGKLWAATKAARVRAADGFPVTLARLREQVVTEGAEHTLPNSAFQAIERTAWEGKSGSVCDVFARTGSMAAVAEYLESAERALRKQLHGRKRLRDELAEGGPKAAELRAKRETIHTIKSVVRTTRSYVQRVVESVRCPSDPRNSVIHGHAHNSEIGK